MTERILAWHFRRTNGTSDYLKRPEIVGKTKRCRGPITCCRNGLHGSIRPLDALKYTPNNTTVICRVAHTGQFDQQDDKLASSRRTLLWQADCTMVLHEFACLCAEDALALVQSPDPRSVAAIACKRRWMRGEVTDAELAAACAAACDAAWDAAWDAARAACDAAWAARDAAWEAACAAACAVRDAQNERLNAMLMALAPEGYSE